MYETAEWFIYHRLRSMMYVAASLYGLVRFVSIVIVYNRHLLTRKGRACRP
jgi:hypothetical protein